MCSIIFERRNQIINTHKKARVVLPCLVPPGLEWQLERMQVKVLHTRAQGLVKPNQTVLRCFTVNNDNLLLGLKVAQCH